MICKQKFRDVYSFTFILISSSLKLGLRMSNYNDNKNYRYSDASYSYNNINQLGKRSQVEYDGIEIVGTRPELNTIYSTIS